MKTLLALVTMTALPLAAQSAVPTSAAAPAATSAVADARFLWQTTSDYVLAAAEQMPESSFAFKPTPDVRSFGQVVAHITNGQQLLCAVALDQKPAETTATTKADVLAALKASNALCSRAYSIPDGESFQPLGAEGRQAWVANGFGTPRTRLHALVMNAWHDNEHYGNIVTYMRLMGMVPPSTARAAAPAPRTPRTGPDETQRTEAAVLAVTEHWSDAEAQGDTAYLERLLAPEYRSVNSDGSVHGRARIISGAAAHGSPAAVAALAEWRRTHHHGTRVVIDHDAAVVSYYPEGQNPENGLTSSDILVYRDNHWQALYSAHTTLKF